MSEELHDGIKLILKRMETHPEEFDGVVEGDKHSQFNLHTKWGNIIARYWEVLTPAETAALSKALTEANRHCMHVAVMKAILVDGADLYQNKLSAQMPLPGIPTIQEYAKQATIIKRSTS